MGDITLGVLKADRHGPHETCIFQIVKPSCEACENTGVLATGGLKRLCCTNRVEGVLPLTPDGFSLQPLFGVCQVQ
jgi:hypothetical protein